MKKLILCTTVLTLLAGLYACQTTTPAPVKKQQADTQQANNPIVFAWPFISAEKMKPRGGMTTGSTVVLDDKPSDHWQALQKLEKTGFEKDRLAILAMQGSYRASFQFLEIAGYSDNFEPAAPYFSWGTEYVHVLEDRGDFISLQHTLVMFFQQPDGSTSEPMIMKHWRQDWQYQDQLIHTYQGDNRWQAQPFKPKAVQGTWSQSVYQVDDSPRYQVQGQWSHTPAFSTWVSDRSPRPLPRREFSVRSDYNILQGIHTITLTPEGWLHEQRNEKIQRQASKDNHLATELGINRYQRIKTPVLTASAQRYWQSTGNYWQAVRNVWRDTLAQHNKLSLKKQVDGKKLYQLHFAYADQLSKSKQTLAHQREHAKSTIKQFSGVY